MILDRIEQASAAELNQGIYQLLLMGTSDRGTYEKMCDPRLLPTYLAIVKADGRPVFSPQNITTAQAEQVMISAINFIGTSAPPKYPAAEEVLLAALDKDNDRVRLAAAKALGYMDAVHASGKVVALTEEMLARNEWGAVARLADTLGRIGDTEARACLQNIVASGQAVDDKQMTYVSTEAQKSIEAIDKRLS